MPKVTYACGRVAAGLAALAVALAAVPASALLLTTMGTWENAVPRDLPLLHGVGTDTLSWGPRTETSALDAWLQSSYSFTGVTESAFALPIGAGETSQFVLGTFTHRNAVIGVRGIEQADLKISLSLSSGTSLLVDLASTFYHDETPNTLTESADVVTLDDTPTAALFSYQGATYRLALTGFLAPAVEWTLASTGLAPQAPSSQGDGPLLRRLATEENHTTRSLLQAEVTRIREPETLSLVGLGLLGLGVALRRRRHAV